VLTSLWGGRKASVMAYASEKRQSAKSSKLAGETFGRLPAISDFLTVLLSSHLYRCNYIEVLYIYSTKGENRHETIG
jgi:hypothetical protein